MFNNKFNPDVIHSFENQDKFRNNTKYELKNIPYKVITKNSKEIKNPEDLKIKLKEDKDEVKNKFNKILDDRKIKLTKVKRNEEDVLKDLNSLSLDSNYMNDFNELRDEFKSDFKDKEEDIVKDREKYNNMIESLLNEGLLG
jgi:hypothetical protein